MLPCHFCCGAWPCGGIGYIGPGGIICPGGVVPVAEADAATPGCPLIDVRKPGGGCGVFSGELCCDGVGCCDCSCAVLRCDEGCVNFVATELGLESCFELSDTEIVSASCSSIRPSI